MELLAYSLASSADSSLDGADYYRSDLRLFREAIHEGLVVDVREGRNHQRWTRSAARSSFSRCTTVSACRRF